MFKPVFIEATTIDDCWHQLLYQAKEKGRRYKITSGSYEGQERLALDFVSGFIHRPHERPLAPRMPEASPLPPPTTDEEINEYFANYIMNVELAPNEHYRYSSWIVGGNKICEVKQLEWIIQHLKESPGNEHCFLSVGQPEWLLKYDEPYKECPKCHRMFNWQYSECPYHGEELIIHEDLRKTTPCLRGLDFRIIENYLMISITYRSWDLLSGWPTNMGGFTLLNEYVASEIGCEPGPLAFSCKSLHIYSHGFDYLNARFGG
jgi:thymidylate synthase